MNCQHRRSSLETLPDVVLAHTASYLSLPAQALFAVSGSIAPTHNAVHYFPTLIGIFMGGRRRLTLVSCAIT